MEKSLFTCPICAAPLERGERAYACPNGHAYDKAREGYVHLLPANKKHSKAPGDDKGMAEARRRFLSGGYYGHLLAALCALGAEYAPPGEAVLDSGCGEGYYTAGLWEALGRPPLAGIDLSKPSVRLAARRVPEGEFAVASAYHLPLADASAGLVLNCFSPLALDEFRRVLRPGGPSSMWCPPPTTCGSSSRCSTTSPTATGRRTSPTRASPTGGWSRWRRWWTWRGRRCATCSR